MECSAPNHLIDENASPRKLRKKWHYFTNFIQILRANGLDSQTKASIYIKEKDFESAERFIAIKFQSRHQLIISKIKSNSAARYFKKSLPKARAKKIKILK